MATAPKAAPKAVKAAAAEPAAEAPPKKSAKKLIILIAAAVVVLGGAGAGAFVFMHGNSAAAAKDKPAKAEPAKLPVFVTLDPFTVNLQAENGDQFLQVTLTLQVPNPEQEELVKNFMPQVRNRLLLLLSSKKASELTSVEGKKKLSEEIITTLNQPFIAKGQPQEISDVLYTSFVIQ